MKNKNKLKKLKNKVVYYADILGVRHLVGNIEINEEMKNETDARTHLTNYLDKCDIEFATYATETILHELLHLSFKNTNNFHFKMDGNQLKDVFDMIHEQEIDRLAMALAKQFPYEGER